MVVLNELDAFLYKDDFSDCTAKVMQRLENEVKSVGDRDCIALFVYSFNELIMSMGVQKSLTFLSALIGWANLLHDEDSSSCSSCIFQFCASQLRPDTMAQLQDLLTTVALVV
jgi:hypothetical protein